MKRSFAGSTLDELRTLTPQPGSQQTVATILALVAEIDRLDKDRKEATRLARDIHETMKRGKATQDHGLIGNLSCILDHACRKFDPPA